MKTIVKIDHRGNLPLSQELLDEVRWETGDTIEVKVLGHWMKLTKIHKKTVKE
jgi:hypothetical protein